MTQPAFNNGIPRLPRTRYQRKTLPGIRQDVDMAEEMIRKERQAKIDAEGELAWTKDQCASLRQALIETINSQVSCMSMMSQMAVRLDAAETALAARAAPADIVTAMNTEAATRAYADAQEGQARIAADNALQTDINTRTRKYAATFGNGLLTAFTFTHNLGTTDVVVQVYATATGGLITPLGLTKTANSVTVTFALAVSANANRVVIVG